MRNLINSQDPHGQIKNDETEEADFNTDANEEIQPNRNTAIPIFMQDILHDEILKKKHQFYKMPAARRCRISIWK